MPCCQASMDEQRFRTQFAAVVQRKPLYIQYGFHASCAHYSDLMITEIMDVAYSATCSGARARQPTRKSLTSFMLENQKAMLYSYSFLSKDSNIVFNWSDSITWPKPVFFCRHPAHYKNCGNNKKLYRVGSTILITMWVDKIQADMSMN